MNKIILLVLAVVMMAWTTEAAPGFRTNNRIGTLLGKNDLYETYRELIDAFLDGAKVDDLIKNSTACLHFLENGYDDLWEASNHLWVRGWTWENHLDLMKALGDFTPIVRVCFNVTDDSIESIREHFGRFDGFIDFATQAKDNAIKHIFDWYDVYAKINDAMTAKRSKDVAFQIGRAVRLLLDFPSNKMSEVELYQVAELPDFREFQDFLKGFLNGTRLLSSDRIRNCVNETEFMVRSLEDANAQFGKGTDDGFREGLFEIADMFAHLKPIHVECQAGWVDVYTVVMKYWKTFSSPLDIAFNAMRHFSQLYQDVLAALQHWHGSNWKDMGRDFGDIFYNVFFDH